MNLNVRSKKSYIFSLQMEKHNIKYMAKKGKKYERTNKRENN